jgi:hypothetical protein
LILVAVSVGALNESVEKLRMKLFLSQLCDPPHNLNIFSETERLFSARVVGKLKSIIF